MQCLKCGKVTKDEQVFCTGCLAVMDAYPVKPDVHVQLPNRPTKKITRKKRPPSAEEQVIALRSKSRRLTAAVILLTLLLGAAGFMLVRIALAPEDVEWGKNYTTETSAD